MSGTYRNEKRLLPEPDSQELLAEAVKRQEYADSGGITTCGHDFWKKDIDYGEAVFCERCSQFFVKIKVLPWIVTSRRQLETYHVESDFYAPLAPRIT